MSFMLTYYTSSILTTLPSNILNISDVVYCHSILSYFLSLQAPVTPISQEILEDDLGSRALQQPQDPDTSLTKTLVG